MEEEGRGECARFVMSHRAQQAKNFYLRIPDDLKLPLYSHSEGYSVRDDSLSGRVQRALQNERAGLPLVKHATPNPGWPRLAGALAFLRRVLGSCLAFAATFSLGVAAGRC